MRSRTSSRRREQCCEQSNRKRRSTSHDRLLSLWFSGRIVRRLLWKQHLNQMAVEFVELAANFDERLAIVLVKPDDHCIEPSERSAKRNLELFVAARVFFGIWEFVLERFLAGLRFRQILLYNIER